MNRKRERKGKMKKIKRLAVVFLILVFLLPGPAFTEEDGPETTGSLEPAGGAGTEEAAGEEAVTEKDGWHFNAKGFLVGENPGKEYLLEDAENGVWQYASKSLSVKITRIREQYNKNKIREYCVAEIWASEKSQMQAILSAETKKLPEGVNQVSPQLLVDKHPCVFAMSDDFYGSRQKAIIGKKGYRQPGIIIRNGVIRWNKTKARTVKAARQRPCLDTLAVYSDGSMKTYISDEMTAEQYLEKGAVQTFAFGPWLISEGKINEKEAVEGCGYYEQMEPLCGLGMVEPYHYIAIVLRGRPKNKYAGAKLSWLADRLLEYGCVEALNLDGGGTACMFFNGKPIIQGQESLRSTGGLIAFGVKKSSKKK